MLDEVGRNAGKLILVSLRGAMLVAAAASAMQAAAITWGSPTNETGSASDVVTAGTFLESAFAGLTDVTLNGVVFAHGTNSSNPGTFADGSFHHRHRSGRVQFTGRIGAGQLGHELSILDERGRLSWHEQHGNPAGGPHRGRQLRGSNFRAVVEQSVSDNL